MIINRNRNRNKNISHFKIVLKNCFHFKFSAAFFLKKNKIIFFNFVKMSLIYSVVARGSTILAEYATARGTFNQVISRILEKIPTTHDSKMSYVYDR